MANLANKQVIRELWQRIRTALVVLLAIGHPLQTSARVISLEEYLNIVKLNNQAMRSASANIEATKIRVNSADLITNPQLFGEVLHQSDSKPPDSVLAGNKSEATVYNIGVQKVWSFGLQSQLSYRLSKIDVTRDSIPPLLAPNVPNPLAILNKGGDFSQGRSQLELTQPIWKNWLGRELDIVREASQSRLEMQRYSEQFKVKAFLAQAEFVYWQLALADDAVRAQELALARFKKIREWVEKRVRLSLADRADFLLAEASVKVRRFELELALRDRTSYRRNFNSLRGVMGDQIEREIMPISSRMLSDMTVETTHVKRLDVEIARSAERIAEQEVQQNIEKFKPSVDLIGSYAMNSQEDKFYSAATLALKPDKPTVLIGIKFSTALDRDIINRERSGLVKMSEAVRFDREQKEFNASQDWDDLLRQLHDSKIRMQLINDIESTQKQKLDYEKSRLERGRTTTYQMLLFEQDFANSQLATIKAKAEVLSIMAKLKSFGDAQ